MSPDTNHISELVMSSGDNVAGECYSPNSIRMNGVHKEAAIPEELLQDKAMVAADVPSEAKTRVQQQEEQDDGGGEDEEQLQEYLQRRDTAVIYPEPVGRPESGESCVILTSRPH